MAGRRASRGVSRAPNCGVRGHTVKTGYKRSKYGKQKTKTAVRQRWLCLAPDGTSHVFVTPDASLVDGRGEGRRIHAMKCPKAAHADGKVRYKGQRPVEKGKPDLGVWKRWQCHPRVGKAHYFQTLDGVASSTLITTVDKVPNCPTHEGASAVVRNGTKVRVGSDGQPLPGSVARQRYRCVPDNTNEPAHYFTLALPRAVVDDTTPVCPVCNDVLTPHQGQPAGARRTRMSLASITQALNDLAQGQSYARVSLDILKRRVNDPTGTHHHHEQGQLSSGITQSRGESWTADAGRNAWRLAADLCEQYSPLFFNQSMDLVHARETAQRATNDAVLAHDSDAALAAPIVYVLDEQPVTVFRKAKAASSHQRSEYSVLIVVELVWHQGRTIADDFPGNYPLMKREARLRLVRAYPSRSETAWKLVLQELGTRPDFVISDASSSILNAVASTWGDTVTHLPSMYHIHYNLRRTLMETPNAVAREGGRNVLVPVFRKHLDLIRRDDALNMASGDWTDWWDTLEALGQQLGVRGAGLHAQRRLYEDRVRTAFDVIRTHPHLPASNAPVEAQIRLTLDPFIGSGRAHRFRNLARTNLLLDLAVCRSQGAFTDIDQVRAIVRTDNEDNKGWAPRPRMVVDTQPRPVTDNGDDTGDRNADTTSSSEDGVVTTDDETTSKPRRRGGAQQYSSLLNPFLVIALYDKRSKSTEGGDGA